QVVFYGLLADEEFLADFLVAITLRHQLDNLFFAVAKERLVAPRTAIRTLREGLHDLIRHAVIEPDFTAIDAHDALHEKLAGRLLQHNAAGAKTHGANDVAIVLGSSQNDDARGQRIEIYFFEYGQAVFIRHAQIEQQNVGLQLGEHLDGLVAVRRL